MQIEAKLEGDGVGSAGSRRQVPPGLRAAVHVGTRPGEQGIHLAGHVATNPDGTLAHPFGKVGAEVSAEEGYQSCAPGRAGRTSPV